MDYASIITDTVTIPPKTLNSNNFVQLNAEISYDNGDSYIELLSPPLINIVGNKPCVPCTAAPPGNNATEYS